MSVTDVPSGAVIVVDAFTTPHPFTAIVFVSLLLFLVLRVVVFVKGEVK